MREALRGLEAFGVIERRRGKSEGVFVANPLESTPKPPPNQRM
ncbi:MAG: hypothetical protein HY673_18180 [Chloroflexi bacterium]|nr:hypothetical protein [Chloroflexota bacterium]